jgi:hypothetical protein
MAQRIIVIIRWQTFSTPLDARHPHTSVATPLAFAHGSPIITAKVVVLSFLATITNFLLVKHVHSGGYLQHHA